MRLHRRLHRMAPVGIVVALLASLAAGCGDDDGVTSGTASPITSEPGDGASAEPGGGDTGGEQVGAGSTVPSEQEGTGAGAETGGETESGAATSDVSEELFPDVVDAVAELAPDGTWTFSATLSSPYDSPQRYADAWRVLGPDGQVLGIRELAHDHASEQPFTRSQSGIVVPDGITTVTVQGRDQVSGWGGATVEVELER